jgi:DNA ligase-associated metallophosphoesterase
MTVQFLQINNNTLELLPQKAIYWNNTETLIVSDVHLGKASHFRKHGMPIPMESGTDDLHHLDKLLHTHTPQRLLILGDLFHSDYNQEWEYFGALRKKYAGVRFTLVRGNHDILKEHHYEKHDIQLETEPVYENGFVFAHNFVKLKENEFSISGHIHPGFVLHGKGRQSITLPCFYKKKNTLIMPAFGRLTGLAHMPFSKDAEIFVLTEDAVHRI